MSFNFPMHRKISSCLNNSETHNSFIIKHVRAEEQTKDYGDFEVRFIMWVMPSKQILLFFKYVPNLLRDTQPHAFFSLL